MLKTRLHNHNYFYLCKCGGYISLKYVVEGLYYTKLDVFSYGVLIPWFADPDRSMNHKSERFKVFKVGPRLNRGQTMMIS